MLNAVVSLQSELEKTSQRLEVSKDQSTSLQQEKEVLQRELNEARAAHNAQVAIHSLSPRSICADILQMLGQQMRISFADMILWIR